MRSLNEEMKSSLCDLLHHLKCLHRGRSREQIEMNGATEGQPKILGYLSHHDGCIQRELAENCHVKASTVTCILAIMERDGLITRAVNPNNRRVLNVYLTDKGKEAHEKIRDVFHNVDEECLEGFSEKERALAMEYLARMCLNLEKRRNQQ